MDWFTKYFRTYYMIDPTSGVILPMSYSQARRYRMFMYYEASPADVESYKEYVRTGGRFGSYKVAPTMAPTIFED